MDTNANNTQPDIILTGAGMMSATPGTLVKVLDPTCSIDISERLDAVAAESSDAWNNAGTEVVHAADNSLIALLGASPGASTAVSIMPDVLEKCFPKKISSAKWQNKLKEMIPTHGKSLAKDGELCRSTRARTAAVLGLSQSISTTV